MSVHFSGVYFKTSLSVVITVQLLYRMIYHSTLSPSSQEVFVSAFALFLINKGTEA